MTEISSDIWAERRRESRWITTDPPPQTRRERSGLSPLHLQRHRFDSGLKAEQRFHLCTVFLSTSSKWQKKSFHFCIGCRNLVPSASSSSANWILHRSDHAARGDDFSPLDFTCPTTEFKVFILSSVERSVAVSRVSLLGLINSLWRLNISTSAVTSMWRLKINHWDSGGRTWLHLFVDYCDSWLVSWLIQGQWLESGN